MTTTQAEIVVTNLRHLDALIAEHLFGWRWYMTDASAERPCYWFWSPQKCCPKGWELEECNAPPADANVAECSPPTYTTFAGMESVVEYLKSKGLKWDIGGIGAESWAMIYKSAREEYEAFVKGPAPIALGVAALASVGVRVRLEVE